MLGLENAIFQQTTKWLCGQCYSSRDVGGVPVDLSKGDVKENLVVQLQLTEQGLKTHHRFLIGVIIFTEYQADFVQHRAKLCLIFGTSFFKKNKIFPSAGMFPHAGHTVLLLLHFPTSTSSLSPKRSNFNEKICNFTDLLDDCLKYQFEEQALNMVAFNRWWWQKPYWTHLTFETKTSRLWKAIPEQPSVRRCLIPYAKKSIEL